MRKTGVGRGTVRGVRGFYKTSSKRARAYAHWGNNAKTSHTPHPSHTPQKLCTPQREPLTRQEVGMSGIQVQEQHRAGYIADAVEAAKRRKAEKALRRER